MEFPKSKYLKRLIFCLLENNLKSLNEPEGYIRLHQYQRLFLQEVSVKSFELIQKAQSLNSISPKILRLDFFYFLCQRILQLEYLMLHRTLRMQNQIITLEKYQISLSLFLWIVEELIIYFDQ